MSPGFLHGASFDPPHRYRWRWLHARVMLFVACASWTLGCSDRTCDPIPCPARFDLAKWCEGAGQCTVAGLSNPCEGGHCTLTRMQPLKLDIYSIWNELSETRDLHIRYQYYPGDKRPPDAENAIALLDSVPGTHVGKVWGSEVVRWSSPPHYPSTLEVRFDDGEFEMIEVLLSFGDATCEEANPSWSNCGL